MVRKSLLLTCLMPLLFGCLPAQSYAAPAPRTIDFCIGDLLWPPYVYFSEGKGLEGYTIDLVNAALETTGITPNFILVPWKRCLAGTLAGTYQVALDASLNEERSDNYFATRPYYEVTPYYFYSRNSHPQGLPIRQPVDLLQQGRICGLQGFNYSNFGISNQAVYMGASSYQAVSEMTHRGRCTLFLARYEIVAGFDWLGDNILSDIRLGFAPIPQVKAETFHMLVSKQQPDAEALRALLDRRITELEASGYLDTLLQKYRR